MSMSVGASSNALSYLQQLLQQGTAGASSAAGGADPLSELLQTLAGPGASTDPLTAPSAATGTAAGSGSSGCAPFGSGMMATMISMQGQPPNGGEMSKMFATFDTNSDGQISKSEFDSAFGQAGVDSATTDAAFAKLDGNGDGSISQSELASAKHHGHHHHHAEGGGESQGGKSSGQSAIDALLSSAGANGATSKTATNADGSTSTTISYADGSTIDMTTPASKSGSLSTATSNSASTQSNANLLEQLIQLQSQMLTAATSTLSAIA